MGGSVEPWQDRGDGCSRRCQAAAFALAPVRPWLTRSKTPIWIAAMIALDPRS
jgi:hypothetical protein